jgi:heptosyltransferase II
MQRILIIAPHWIGDAVMSQPLLAGLKQTNASQTIDVLCTPWVAPIYRACKEINKVIEVDFQHGALQWGLRRSIAKQIKANAYNRAFVLPNSFKSALIPWLAGIPIRIGYRGELRFGLINHVLANPSRQARTPMVEHYVRLLEATETSLPSLSTSLQPKLSITDRAIERVKVSFEGLGSKPFYVFAPGAEYGPAKRWPSSHFAELATKILRADANAQIIILGSKADHVLGQAIHDQSNATGRIHNWCGVINLEEAMAVIAQSAQVISNDSGLMHIAAALSVPQIALFGSSNPKHTPPLSKQAKVIWLGLACSPCYQRICPLGHLDCLTKIEAEQVYTMLKPN